ncbi:hypothetical protein ACFL2R_03755 [Patescibacteria group bacterium]
MDISKVRRLIGVFLVLVLFGVTFSTLARENSSSESIFNDADQDGLSDDEEGVYGTDPNNSDTDGDGYSDGTEISSGYDPLKPAPGDKIVQDGEEVEKLDLNLEMPEGESSNMTQDLSEKIIAMISSGESNNSTLTASDIDGLVDDFMDDEITFDDLPEVDEERIQVKEQDYDEFSEEKQLRKKKEDNEEYVVALAYLAIENSPYKITDPEDLQGFENELVKKIGSMTTMSEISSNSSYFKNIVKKAENFLGQIDNIEVPEEMIPLHKKGIQLMTKAVALRDEVGVDEGDPIKSLINISKVQKLILLSMDFYEEVSSELEAVGITEIPVEL